ncbi:DnaB-like helicase C-terminal domain-containing protein [Sulfurimonas sp.]|uniref:DnaB-like helicase C-terminal domain-containing protein n=1 Tax=Sulfurimonas sp. TaxID=2022749 RepID=UPI0035692173
MKENILSNFKNSQELAYESMEYIKELKAGKSVLDDTDPNTKYFLLHTLSPAIKRGKGVILFSYKMPAKELGLRLLSIQTSIPLEKLCVGDMDDKQWERLGYAFDKMSAAKLFIYDQDVDNALQFSLFFTTE